MLTAPWCEELWPSDVRSCRWDLASSVGGNDSREVVETLFPLQCGRKQEVLGNGKLKNQSTPINDKFDQVPVAPTLEAWLVIVAARQSCKPYENDN